MLSPVRSVFNLFVLSALCCALPTLTVAQNLSRSSVPVEITADKAIEWLRDQYLYRATGKAMVKQGDTTITADTIEASYDPNKGEQDIQTVTAIGHVTITSQDRTITADRGVYDLAQGLATLTGSVITITSPDIKVTAHHNVTYNDKQRHATASGKASVTAQGRTLTADHIEVWLGDAQKKTSTTSSATGQLERARARGHVTIKTAKEILQANQADYDAVKQEAVMTGQVRLTQGENHMQGERAVVNLKTGVSQLFGHNSPSGSATGGRVKAIFVPGKNDTAILPGNAARDMIPLRPDDNKTKGQK